jgi:DNA-binding NarL/FixJ family response regulator
MSSPRIRVAVVHDNFLTRAGLTATFESCADMAVRAIDPVDTELLHFDVAVADWRSGMSLLTALRRRRPNGLAPRVAIVASSDFEWQIRDAVECGAAAYMLLGATCEELVGAVRSVHEGGCHLSPSIAAKLAQSLTTEALTAREEEVLALVAEGLCNKQVAKMLDIGIGTVKTHLRAAFGKLQVGSRAEATVMARRRGILRHASSPTKPVLAEPAPPARDARLRARWQADRSLEFQEQGAGT